MGENRATLVNPPSDFPKGTCTEKGANSTHFNFSHDQEPVNDFTWNKKTYPLQHGRFSPLFPTSAPAVWLLISKQSRLKHRPHTQQTKRVFPPQVGNKSEVWDPSMNPSSSITLDGKEVLSRTSAERLPLNSAAAGRERPAEVVLQNYCPKPLLNSRADR